MTNPATKQAIVRMTAKVTGQSQRQTCETADVLLHIIGQLIAQGHAVRLPDIGAFSVTQNPKRVGIDPRNGEKITIKSRKIVRFRAARALKEAVNGPA